MAGVEGLEPSRTVLETGMLPLHYTPIFNFKYVASLESTYQAFLLILVDQQGLEPRTNRL